MMETTNKIYDIMNMNSNETITFKIDMKYYNMFEDYSIRFKSIESLLVSLFVERKPNPDYLKENIDIILNRYLQYFKDYEEVKKNVVVSVIGIESYKYLMRNNDKFLDDISFAENIYMLTKK